MPLAQRGGKRPVFSLNPVPGALDAIVSSELLETTRQIGNGMASPDRTRVISSTARTLTTQERMQLGDGRSDTQELMEIVRRFSRAHHLVDMAGMAKEAGTVVSAVMLGAVAGSGVFPFAREHYEAVVKRSGASAAASLLGFAAAFERTCHAGPDPASTVPRLDGLRVPGSSPGQAQPAMTDLGHGRVCEYQDAAYGQLYLQRVQAVEAAERAADPQGTNALAITQETARWLALWMAFDDIVRVADLKSRASRWQRVRGEVKAGDDDLVRLYDHFKPGVPEFAALLPEGLANRLLAWDRRRVARGLQPWAMPLKVGTHGIGGMLALRTLASLKWLRVRGSRYAAEQKMIERWLRGITEGAARDWRLGHEVALCGRLIKGYGSTNERGKENLLHVLDHLALKPDAAQAADAVRAAREAALADEAGTMLDATLAAHGAPARPVKAQPIHWTRPPKGLATPAR